MTRLFIPDDAASLSMGADKVADALTRLPQVD